MHQINAGITIRYYKWSQMSQNNTFFIKVASAFKVHVSVDQQKIKYFRTIHIQIMNDTVELPCLTFRLRQSVMKNPRL